MTADLNKIIDDVIDYLEDEGEVCVNGTGTNAQPPDAGKLALWKTRRQYILRVLACARARACVCVCVCVCVYARFFPLGTFLVFVVCSKRAL